MKKLSRKSLEILNALFGEESQLQISVSLSEIVGLAENVIEIRNWVKEQLQEQQEDEKNKK
jgi:hypothetical protein